MNRFWIMSTLVALISSQVNWILGFQADAAYYLSPVQLTSSSMHVDLIWSKENKKVSTCVICCYWEKSSKQQNLLNLFQSIFAPLQASLSCRPSVTLWWFDHILPHIDKINVCSMCWVVRPSTDWAARLGPNYNVPSPHHLTSGLSSIRHWDFCSTQRSKTPHLLQITTEGYLPVDPLWTRGLFF